MHIRNNTLSCHLVWALNFSVSLDFHLSSQISNSPVNRGMKHNDLMLHNMESPAQHHARFNLTLETEFAEYSESERCLCIIQFVPRYGLKLPSGVMMVRVFAIVRATSVSPDDQCMNVQVKF